MKSVSSNLAKLKSNVEWAMLPLSDRTGWTRVRFGDVVENCAETCDPQGAELEQFFTLLRGVCPRFLVIARSTIDPAAPKGQKEIAQGRAKRRPGYIAHWYRFRLMIRPDFRFGSGGWPIPIWRQIRMEFRLASCRLDSVFNIRQTKFRPKYAGAAPHNASAAALSGFRLFVSPATVPPGSDRLGTIDLPISTLS
jgi:hypothetical protein